MRTSEKTWDVKVTNAGGVNLPLPIMRAFRKRGFTRISIELREDGLLLKPYSGRTPPTKQNERDTVELPF